MASRKTNRMADIFVDTGGWGHLFAPKELYHQLAYDVYQLARQQKYKLVTTSYVIAELVALLTSPLRIYRPTIIRLVDDLKASPHVEIIYIDALKDEQAWQLLKKREDKEWSLVDCSSFIVMQELGITEALTSDQHFEQAGFVRLLKS